MSRISERVQGFTESVIREMTRVVSQLGGVNLAQGMPNFPPPKELLQAAHRAIDGDFHQYAITWGTPGLRAAIADKYRKVYGMNVDPERHVTVCCGSTETMLATLLAVLNPGDEVVIFEPFYENYGPGCIISGAEPVWIPLEGPDSRFFKRRTVRRKYVHRTEPDVAPLIAPLPASLQERGLAAPGLLAYVLVSKYCDHLPLYRLEHIFQR